MGARNIISDDEEELEDEEEEIRDDDDIQNDDEDEEDAEDGQDGYEQDGFIVDDVDEGEEEEARESSDEEVKVKKKKKKKREAEEDYQLDEDDYELLQEANVTGFQRPKSGSKKFKRLKKAERNINDVEEAGFSDDEETEGFRMEATAEEKIKRALFGDDEGSAPDDVADDDQLDVDEDVPLEEEEDEMADFIVDEDDIDENGQLVRRRKSKKKVLRQAPGISSLALQEAQDIFGDVDELLILCKEGLRENGLDENDEDASKSLEKEFEPSILTAKYMRPEDDDICKEDVLE